MGLADGLGERFASGEGIQDALFQTPSMLFQTDEIDGMLQSINKAKDARHEAIMSTLLTMYSSANSVFPMRRKAGKESPGVIDQPNLVIFGTAIPNHYYEALSERMLTNGFFARMIILERGRRPRGRSRASGSAAEHPRHGQVVGGLPTRHGQPGGDPSGAQVVEHSDGAARWWKRATNRGGVRQGGGRDDSVGTTVWGRVSEQVRKLALLYAISENHQAPRIGLAAVEWASAFVMHQAPHALHGGGPRRGEPLPRRVPQGGRETAQRRGQELLDSRRRGGRR